MAAQGYQESTLDQNVRSPVGAIGVMQVMPADGKDLKVGDITQTEANIHAGVKYMRFMMDQVLQGRSHGRREQDADDVRVVNAGPGRIKQLRREAEKEGLDPNVWIGNVERVASARNRPRDGHLREQHLQRYLYVAYKLVVANLERRAAAKAQVGKRQ